MAPCMGRILSNSSSAKFHYVLYTFALIAPTVSSFRFDDVLILDANPGSIRLFSA